MKKICIIPNRGARLGHQFVEWLVGYIFCKNNNYIFYHHDFTFNAKNTDKILNLSYGEKLYNNYRGNILTINNMSFQEYLNSNSEDLYVYDWYNKQENIFNVTNEMLINENIRNILRTKYYSNNIEKNNYDIIAIHIRRDDVRKDNQYSIDRYINIKYFIDILEKLYLEYPTYEIKIFSSNIDEDFYAIKNTPFKNISFHINDSLEKTLHYMINSKILITSKSGLSFIASLISENNNIKICPTNFWHYWPAESIINYEL
jgi:hypothetical protein